MTSTTIQPTAATAASHQKLRSIGAVAAAFFTMAILTTIIDQVLHVVGVFPPWGQAYYETGPYLLAVAYRAIFGVLGGYLAARWAPRSPARHALALGVIGVVLSGLGIVVPTVRELGPAWYPIVLMLIALPTARLGASLYAAGWRHDGPALDAARSNEKE